MKTVRNILLAGCSAAVLTACNGASDVASPGAGTVNVNISNPAPTPTPTPAPTSSLVTPATGCPTIADPQGLADGGTITGPTGTYRICTLPARFVRSVTLPKISGLLYQLAGRTDVGYDNGPTALSSTNTRTVTDPSGATITLTADSNVTLTIQPGVIIYANTGVAWLNVNRGNKIQAAGTASAPIIFTSRDNILGLNTDNSSGQWGGVVLSGRAPITDCAASSATPGTVACERQTEGAVDPALYGGATATDNSGTLSFVQIRYSGYVLSANSELQSLTTQGVGSGTTLDHIQTFNSSDDGAEFFGGRVNMKYYISVGAEDDNLDTDTGVKANFQYVIAVQRNGATPAIADAMIEADSDNGVDGDNPRQNVFLSNFTFIDRVAGNSDVASILLRGGTDYTLVNGVMLNTVTNPCLRISRAQTASTTQNAAIDEYGAPQFRSVVFNGCGSQPFVGANSVTDAQVSAIFGSGSNNNNVNYTPTLTSLFVNGANETAVTAFNAATFNGQSFNGTTLTPTGFFDTTTYIGAVKDANDNWYKGWTCNSGTASFGTGNTGLCTSLPTT
ncbi:hypothetical protein [Sphingomonas sp.]|uniref:hypothetical protein n=1 Tax=Sphingomonas sp. TaxID=28214 RepID=UPI001ED35C22|nr:hypothetical protein [Sphingomonas sp.]MBX3595225.1 hypothetical protein [Sphingomonas sp.]